MNRKCIKSMKNGNYILWSLIQITIKCKCFCIEFSNVETKAFALGF